MDKEGALFSLTAIEMGKGFSLMDDEDFGFSSVYKLPAKKATLRIKLRDWICSPLFQYFMSGLVVLNLCLSIAEFVMGIFVANGTIKNIYKVEFAQDTILKVNLGLLILFNVEVLVRGGLIGYKLYFQDGWNVFDFVIIFLSCILEALYMADFLKALQKAVTVGMAFRLWNALRIVHLIGRTLTNQEQAKLDVAQENYRSIKLKLEDVKGLNLRLCKERFRYQKRLVKFEKELELVQAANIDFHKESWQNMVPIHNSINIRSNYLKDKSLSRVPSLTYSNTSSDYSFSSNRRNSSLWFI
jgi:hypothetical protein